MSSLESVSAEMLASAKLVVPVSVRFLSSESGGFARFVVIYTLVMLLLLDSLLSAMIMTQSRSASVFVLLPIGDWTIPIFVFRAFDTSKVEWIETY